MNYNEYHKNPRTISPERYAQLEESLGDLGDLSPIVHNTTSDEIIGGNQRGKVFGMLGTGEASLEIIREFDPPTRAGTTALGFIAWQDELFAYRAVSWTAATCERANIAANALGGGWDWNELAKWDVEDLETWGLDAEALAGWEENTAGFGEMLDAQEDYEETALSDAEPQIDKAAELCAQWGVKTGQLWEIQGGAGMHMLFCGDSITGSSEMGRADIVITDPPYDMGAEDVLTAIGSISSRAAVLSGAAQAFSLCTHDWKYRIDFVWKHRQPRSFPTPYQPVFYHNNIIMMTHGGERLGWKRPRKNFGSVIEIESVEFPNGEMGHTKATELFTEIISGFDFGVIGDPFTGSGTTFVAAERMGRVCIGYEIDPRHVALALERLHGIGLKPHLRNAPANLA